jgi:hypothetical protein
MYSWGYPLFVTVATKPVNCGAVGVMGLFIDILLIDKLH